MPTVEESFIGHDAQVSTMAGGYCCIDFDTLQAKDRNMTTLTPGKVTLL